MYQFEFKGTPNQVLDHVKWCRQQFGPRGQGWDLSGNYLRVTILITDSKHATFYALKYGHKQIA